MPVGGSNVLNRLKRKLFEGWEALFHRMFRLQELVAGEEHLFYIAKRKYMGKSFVVDGVSVGPGDTVIELHFNNEIVERLLVQNDNLVRAMVQLILQARKSMPALVEAVQAPQYADVHALYGITFINRGIERFGFHTRPMQSGFTKKLTTWHLKNVLRMYNPDADHVITAHEDVLEPKIVVASKARLIELFGQLEQVNHVPPENRQRISVTDQYTVQS